MEVKSRGNNIIIRVIFIVILIFIGFIITNLIVDGLRNARVNILVAPYGATVKIDGKEVNGSTRFYPKKNVEDEISKYGFLPKKINIDLCFYVLYTYFRGHTKKKPLIAVTIRGWHITYIPARSTNHAT